MPHSADLIQSILAEVQKDYPASQYIVAIEKAIPGTRMHPDILVCDIKGNAMCAVEIGYTRPEKLTAYRDELKIPDVRWYDKAGNLHADVKECVVKVSVEIQPPTGRFVVYAIHEMVACQSDVCLQDEPPVTDGDDAVIAFAESLAEETVVWVITDYNRIWFCCYCDKCGDQWSAAEEDSDDVWAIAEELRTLSAREFASSWGARIFEGDWDSAVKFLNLPLNYQDGEFLDADGARNFNQALTAIRRDAIQPSA